jgi:hypothetical protein
MENHTFKKKCRICGKPLRKRPTNWYKDFKQRDTHVKCWKEEKKRLALLEWVKSISKEYETN